jgi:hypothetical protein
MRGPQGLPAFCINAGLGNSLKASFRIDAGLGNAGKLAEAAATRPAAEAAEAEKGSPAAAAATASQAAAETGSPAAVAATASQAAGSTFATTSAAATASAAARLERGLPPGGVPPGEVSGATWAVAPIRAGGQGRKRYATGCDGAVALCEASEDLYERASAAYLRDKLTLGSAQTNASHLAWWARRSSALGIPAYPLDVNKIQRMATLLKAGSMSTRRGVSMSGRATTSPTPSSSRFARASGPANAAWGLRSAPLPSRSGGSLRSLAPSTATWTARALAVRAMRRWSAHGGL